MKYIKNLNFVLTNKCNLKCSHCDIWNNGDNSYISFSKFKEIINDEFILESYNFYKDKFEISLSGGEIFLIEKLDYYYNYIKKIFPESKICISTNGILQKNIIDFLTSIKDKNNIKINISIDGNEKIHDLQRGIDGSFKKTIKTILNIKKGFPYILLEIKLTITNKNFDQIYYFTKLSNKLGIFFSFKPVENIKNYTNKTKSIKIGFTEKNIKIIEKEIINNIFIEKQDFYKSKKFFEKIPNYLRNGLSKEEKMKCNIAENDFEIMPNLDVFSCIMMDKIGNLGEENARNIVTGKIMKKQKDDIKLGKCIGCMLMCGSAKTKEIYN